LRFFAPQGRHCTDGVKFGTEEGCQISPHRCNVSPLRGEEPQNRPLGKLNTGRFALRAMLPVMILKQQTSVCAAIRIGITVYIAIQISSVYSSLDPVAAIQTVLEFHSAFNRIQSERLEFGPRVKPAST